MEMSCHNLNGSTLAKIHIINIIQARNEGSRDIPLSGLTWLYSHFDFWKKKSSQNPGTDCYCRGNYGGHAKLRVTPFLLSTLCNCPKCPKRNHR